MPNPASARPDAPSDEIERAAGVIRDSAHAAIQELREVIGLLREMDAGAPAVVQKDGVTAR
jgi:hypothetical protein